MKLQLPKMLIGWVNKPPNYMHHIPSLALVRPALETQLIPTFNP
jgi:hypothetical protein